MLNYSLPCSCS